MSNKASITLTAANKDTIAAAIQGALTMISDLSSGFPESELHQTPEQQKDELEKALKLLGEEPQD